MHTLYLLRHAKSSWSDPALPDLQRPLSRRGRRDGRRVGEHLARLEPEPTLVLCSVAERTRETLELVRPAFASTTFALEPGLYAASAAELLRRLHAVPDEVAALMLIGHNPGLHELALFLVSAGAELERLSAKFPTAALATLTVREGGWRGLSQGAAELAAYVVPKQLA